MKWLRMLFKEHIKVYVPVDDQMRPIEQDGTVKFVYKLSASSPSYSAKLSNLSRIEGAQPEELDLEMPQSAPQSKASNKKKKPTVSTAEVLEPPEIPAHDDTIPPGTIVVYTDGGCAPNPGPGGLGIIMIFGNHTLEKWEFYPHVTNNFCELTAILHALQQIKNKSLPVLLYSDSAYAIGVSTGAMKATKNVELVNEIRAEAAKFTNLQILKVRAHCGIQHNEHVDQLCALARSTRESGERRS